jgi:hypothetical protein
MEDALNKLDKLTNEEVWMVAAQTLKAAQTVGDRMTRVDNKVAVVIHGVELSSIIHPENIFKPELSRGRTSESSHTTNSNRHR